jgi:hypothetical protein
MDDWEPIATAKEGEWVYVYGKPYSADGSSYGVGRYKTRTIERWDFISDTLKELRRETMREWEGIDLHPTHWKPLGPAPDLDQVREEKRG